MNILLTYSIINYFVSSCLSIPTNLNNLQEEPIFTTNSSKNQKNMVVQQINELQQQKDDLLRELNKAMEESVAVLKNSNVTNAQQGVSYIEDLKIQIKNIANANDKNEHDLDVYSDNGSAATAYNGKMSVLADARRQNSDKLDKQKKNIKINNKIKTNAKTNTKPNTKPNTKTNIKTNTKTNTKMNTNTNNDNKYNKYIGRSGNTTVKKEKSFTLRFDGKLKKARGDEKFLISAEKELDSLLNTGLSGQRLKDRLKRRQKMKDQLDAWVRLRYEERKKIKEYREKMKKSLYGKLETCPRRGFSSPDITADLEHSTKASARYPCCRKCCKMSYLGCLK